MQIIEFLFKSQSQNDFLLMRPMHVLQLSRQLLSLAFCAASIIAGLAEVFCRMSELLFEIFMLV